MEQLDVLWTQRARLASDGQDTLLQGGIFAGEFGDQPDDVVLLFLRRGKCEGRTLETNGNTLTMKSSSAEIGRVEEKMNIEKDKEENITISFSARYVMEALKVLDKDECEISFVGEVNPIIFKDVENDDLIQLVLPIRTY